MVVVVSFSCHKPFSSFSPQSRNRLFPNPKSHDSKFSCHLRIPCRRRPVIGELNQNPDTEVPNDIQDGEVDNAGVKIALSMLRFYKREISPILPNSCRYVPTCSEYSMIAYRKYGVLKGTVLTAWRLCRCNPLGGSGFDPPRWFDESSPPEE